MSNNEIKVGSIVYLKSFPKLIMTVEKIIPSTGGAGSAEIHTVWTVNGADIVRDSFVAECLSIVKNMAKEDLEKMMRAAV